MKYILKKTRMSNLKEYELNYMREYPYGDVMEFPVSLYARNDEEAIIKAIDFFNSKPLHKLHSPNFTLHDSNDDWVYETTEAEYKKEESEMYEVDCISCGDGGCISCRPSWFI